MKKTHQIHVIPLTVIRQKTPVASFSYACPDRVPDGSLVEVPFGSRSVRGVSVSAPPMSVKGASGLKEITKVIEKSYVNKKQLRLAEYVSREYFAPIGLALKACVPRKTARKSPLESVSGDQEPVALTADQKRAVRELNKDTQKSALLFGPAGSGKTEVYIEYIRKHLRQGKQALVLLPEIMLTAPALEHYARRLGGEKVAALNSTLTGGQFSSVWESVRSGEVKIILGSRAAMFAPFKNLKTVILDESQDPSYKQWDAAPRYDSRTVAAELARIHGARLIFGSATPRLEEWRSAQEGKSRLVTLPDPKKQGLRAQSRKVEIVNMRLEHWKKKQKRYFDIPVLSDALLAEIRFALKYKYQSMLLINRQGMSAFSLCTRCKEVFRCPRCDRALVSQRSGHFFCLHCHFRTKSFPSCPSCGNISFANKGLGTQKVAEVVEREFPGARVFVADSSTMQKRGAQEKLHEELASRKIDILIGTQMISKGWNLPHLSVVGVVDADSLFSIPDFNTDERGAQLLFQCAGRVGRSVSKVPGRVFVQTYQPERAVFEDLSKGKYGTYIEREMESRESLGYPPFGRLVLLIGKHKNEKTLQKNARELCKVFVEKLGENMKIFPPSKPQKHKIRDLFIRHIVIRFPSGEVPEDLRASLEKLPAGWHADVDPVTIV